MLIIIVYYLLVLQTRTALSKAIEDTGVSDPHTLDKSYWIQRVGEVGSCHVKM